MPATALLLSALAVAVPATAPASQPEIAYVGVARDASLEQAALLSWGDEGDAIVVKSIYKRDDAGGRVSTRSYRGAAVLPGHYELSMMCSVSGSPVFLVFEAEFAAGKRYQLACEGRTARSVKVVSTEI
jgi:hypothetical protein